jgi:hypothetical protein
MAKASRRAFVAQAGLAGSVAAALTVGCGTPAGSSAPAGGGALKGVVRLYGWDQEPISSSRRRAMDGFRQKYPQLDV